MFSYRKRFTATGNQEAVKKIVTEASNDSKISLIQVRGKQWSMSDRCTCVCVSCVAYVCMSVMFNFPTSSNQYNMCVLTWLHVAIVCTSIPVLICGCFIPVSRLLWLFTFVYTDAARRFFQSKCEEEALKDKGMYERKVTLQRHRNRQLRVSSVCAL